MLLFRLGSLVFSDISDFIWILLVFLLLAVLLFFFIKSCVAQHRADKKLYAELDEPVQEPELTAHNAVVISKHSEIVNGGSPNFPTHGIAFYAVFKTFDNKTFKLRIPEEIFKSISENQAGTLVMQENEFYDFK